VKNKETTTMMNEGAMEAGSLQVHPRNNVIDSKHYQLSANLKSMTEKFSMQKKEIDNLTLRLLKKDEEIATLKDELFWAGQLDPNRHINPSRYPAQEPRVTVKKMTSFFEDNAFSLLATKRDTTAATAATKIDTAPKNDKVVNENLWFADDDDYSNPKPNCNDTENILTEMNNHPPMMDGTIRLHIVSYTHGIHLEMNVNGSISIQQLKSDAFSLLVLYGHINHDDLAKHSLYYKGNELNDELRNLDSYEVFNNAALVIMPPLRPLEIAERGLTGIESKFEELTAIARKSQDEIAHVLQLQLSLQESSNDDALANLIGEKIKELLKESLIVQRDQAQTEICEAIPSLWSGEIGSLGGDVVQHGRSLELSAILPEVDATLHVDDSRGTSVSTFAYEIAPPREINVNQTIVDTSQIDMYSPQEKVKQSSMKETLDFTMMLGSKSPNMAQTQFVKSLSTGSLDDMDKSVDLDALHKVTGLESRPHPSQGYLLYRGTSDEREDHIIGESAPDSPSELGSYTSSELNHHESRPFLFTEESLKGIDIVSHEEVHSSEITAKVTNTSDLPSNVHLPNKVDVPIVKTKPIAKPDEIKKKKGIISFLKLSKSKSPKSKKSTMVEI
jgi:hypothetical protein